MLRDSDFVENEVAEFPEVAGEVSRVDSLENLVGDAVGLALIGDDLEQDAKEGGRLAEVGDDVVLVRHRQPVPVFFLNRLLRLLLVFYRRAKVGVEIRENFREALSSVRRPIVGRVLRNDLQQVEKVREISVACRFVLHPSYH